MSGGSYDYAYRILEEFADDLQKEGGCSCALPVLREAFAKHCRMVAAAMRACEWNDSGDGDHSETELIKAVIHPRAVYESLHAQLLKAADAVMTLIGENRKASWWLPIPNRATSRVIPSND